MQRVLAEIEQPVYITHYSCNSITGEDFQSYLPPYLGNILLLLSPFVYF